MVVSFHRVGPELLDRATEDPAWAHEHRDDLTADGLDGYLDKAWDGLQFLMNAENLDVDLFFDGDMIGEDGTLFGWPAHVVASVAETLRNTPFDRLARHYDGAKMDADEVYPRIWADDTSDCLAPHYQTLVTFFDTTARSSAAAVMTFSF